jgi:hypothetical protein
VAGTGGNARVYALALLFATIEAAMYSTKPQATITTPKIASASVVLANRGHERANQQEADAYADKAGHLRLFL